MSEPAIQVSGLRKSYGPVLAVDGIDLEVHAGEIFGFLGPNGAGKTTTIRCMLDLIRPNAGQIRLQGVDPQADPVAVRRMSGYLPGELHLPERMTVETALRYFAALRGNSFDFGYARELAERLDLDLSRAVRNLSKGNKQKVGVVQAFMHQPPLLLLDEPTVGLDPLVQQLVLGIIREAKDAGTTVFFLSHNLSEVQAIADRVAIIRQGKIIELAATEHLIQRSLRRATVRFKKAVDTRALGEIAGVSLLSQDNGLTAILQVEGEMDPLIKALAALPVSDFETERPSLEEIFLKYYSLAD